MALYIGTENNEPVVGDLKVGTNNVEKIYQGTILIWPST